MSLDEAVRTHIAKMNMATKPKRHGEWTHYYEEKRHVSHRGNVVVTIVEQGECEWGGPEEDPFFAYYENAFEAVFSPTGELLSSRYLG